MVIDIEELWEKGGYGKDNPFDRSMEFIRKTAVESKLTVEDADVIISEFFIELANGKQYPTDKCPCGCGIDKSGTAAVHEMVKRVKERAREIHEAKTRIMTENLNNLIKKHVAKREAPGIARKSAQWLFGPTNKDF